MDEATRAKCVNILLNAWEPHSAQREVLEKIFNSQATIISVFCGRKFGKTELVIFALWMQAILMDGAEVFYSAPEKEQLKKIGTRNRRLQTCNTGSSVLQKKLEKVMGGKIIWNKSELTLEFPNGSIITCDGTNSNVESDRGASGDLLCVDEVGQLKEGWLSATRPNMAARNGKMVFISSPPQHVGPGYEIADECMQEQLAGNPKFAFFNLPSWRNDKIEYIQNNSGIRDTFAGWLLAEQRSLFKKGRETEYYREYAAQFILNSDSAVIPQINRTTLRKNHEYNPSGNELKHFVVIEPTNSLHLGILFCTLDVDTRILHIRDSYKTDDTNKTSSRQIAPIIKEFCKKFKVSFDQLEYHIPPDRAWFIDSFAYATGKHLYQGPIELKKTNEGIDLIKDCASLGRILIYEDAMDLVRNIERWVFISYDKMSSLKDKPLANALRTAVAASALTADPIIMKHDYNHEHPADKAMREALTHKPDEFDDLENFDFYVEY